MSRKSSSATVSNKPELSFKQEVVETSNPSTNPIQNIPSPMIASIDMAPDALNAAIILDNPVDSQASRINENALRRLCSTRGIPFDDVLIPSRQDSPHLTPAGYSACKKFICWVGSVPPFNSFLIDVLQYIEIAPAPHSRRHRYVYRSKRRSDSPYFVFLEPHDICRILTGAWIKFAQYKQEWFYVRCPTGFARSWLEESISPRPEGSRHSEAVEAIRAVPMGDRDIRSIISNESLSKFGLLVEGRRINLPHCATKIGPALDKGKRQVKTSTHGAPDTPKEGEIRATEVSKAPGENVSPSLESVVEAHDIDVTPPPSKGKKKLAYKLRKKTVGGTYKATITPVEKEPSP
uniref:Uncharacterized protein n=1 Tax=Allium cepa TaxID=4679 RepID=Q2XNX5_ALLCE|nr:hypothetical protein 11.t00006 [Allium cepa]